MFSRDFYCQIFITGGMKKVLLCSPRGKVGGICSWTENILSHAEKKDDIFLKWYYCHIPSDATTKDNTFNRIISGIKTYIPFLMGLKSHIRKEGFDVVHFSTSGGLSFIKDFIALKMCRKAGINTVLHFHFGRLPQILTSKTLERKFLERCMPYIDRFVTMDLESYNSLVSYGCKNVFLIPNPLSEKVENLITQGADLQRKTGLIVYAGHVIPTKGVFELIKACRDIPDIKLELLGACSDNMRESLCNTAGRNPDKWLNIRGNCSLEEVIETMKRCDIFVLPSYTEGFPNVILESMAAGCAIISTPVGAIPQILEDDERGKYGILVPPKDVDALQNVISNLLYDERLKKELRRNVQQRVHEDYNINTVWKNLVAVWESC